MILGQLRIGARQAKNAPLLCTATERKAAGSCTLNFDATDLPHSSFEPLYPKLVKNNPKPFKVRFVQQKQQKKIFLAKQSMFVYRMSYIFLKAI